MFGKQISGKSAIFRIVKNAFHRELPVRGHFQNLVTQLFMESEPLSKICDVTVSMGNTIETLVPFGLLWKAAGAPKNPTGK